MLQSLFEQKKNTNIIEDKYNTSVMNMNAQARSSGEERAHAPSIGGGQGGLFIAANIFLKIYITVYPTPPLHGLGFS